MYNSKGICKDNVFNFAICLGTIALHSVSRTSEGNNGEMFKTCSEVNFWTKEIVVSLRTGCGVTADITR